MSDGSAISGVEIAWLDERGKTLTRAETNGDGHAAFAERPRNAKVIVARKGKQISLLALKEPALDLSECDVTGEPYQPVRLFAYTGRDLYRPGESFYLSVFARDADGKPVSPQPVKAILKRPDGKSQVEAIWKPDERWQWLAHGRIVSGGSTLTMQVARLLDPVPHSISGKLRQIARALQIEAHYSKREILRLYLNLAPMGGVGDGERQCRSSGLCRFCGISG